MKFNYSQILPPHQKKFKKLLSYLQKNFKVNIEDNAIRAFGNNKELWFKFNIKGETLKPSVYDFDKKKFYSFKKYDQALNFLDEEPAEKAEKLIKKNKYGMRSLF